LRPLVYWEFRNFAVSFCFNQMKVSLYAPAAPAKRFMAAVCLLTVLLLWTPLWAAALSANGLGCCDGAMCLAQSHSGATQGSAAAAPAQNEAPMQCDHARHGAAMDCDMSCCHQQNHSFVASIQFVLPPPPAVLLPQLTVEGTSTLRFPQVLQAFDPLSPPPRTANLSA